MKKTIMRRWGGLLAGVLCWVLSAAAASAATPEAFFKMIDDGDIRGVEAAIRQGFEIDRAYEMRGDRRLPLHEAVTLVRPAIVGLLLAEGADPNIRSTLGETPIYSVIAIATAPADGGTIDSIKQDAFAVFELLLEAGASPDVVDRAGATPLSWAVSGEDPEYALQLTQKLLAKGANANLKSGRTSPPLFWAIERADEELRQGRTAGVSSRAEIVRLLLKAEAFPNYHLPDGNTPLHFAIVDPLLAKALLDGGAMHRIVNNAGESPLSLARARGLSEVVALFEARD